MDELNLQMEEPAAGDSAQELKPTYDQQSTVVIFEETPATVEQVTGAASAQQATGNADLKSKCWTHEATLLLIELYKSYQDSMKDPRIKKKNVWNRIALDMAVNGYHFHGDMCDKKWRNLKKSYFSVLESKSIPGQSRRLWQYFDILSDVFPKESNSTEAANAGTVVVTAAGGGGVEGTNGTVATGQNHPITRSATSKMAKTRPKISTVTAAGSAVMTPASNSGLSHGTHVIAQNEMELLLTDGALEDMSPVQALKVLLDRQERNEERRMSRMMEELRKMHDENLEVMHERNVLLHRLIEQLSSGT